MLNIENDARVCFGIAQGIAPFDTGNLRYNAMKYEMTNRGFRIRYSMSEAFYIYFLEEGTRKLSEHAGFIEQITAPAIANYLYNKYESRDKFKTRKIQNYAINKFKQYNEEQIDYAEMPKRRLSRLNSSRSIDVDKMAKDNKWQSIKGAPVPDWKERDFVI